MNTITQQDPICGMRVIADQSAIAYTFLGETYVFCCAECRDIFARAPERLLALLAHEEEGVYGHRCPCQRAASGAPVSTR